MGFDIEIFIGEVDNNLICSICAGVFEDPVQLDCDHTFCKRCISSWFKRNHNTCPIDRNFVPKSMQRNLKSATRTVKNIINGLKVKCIYEIQGCNCHIQLETRESHVLQCKFNPQTEIECEHGCGITLKRSEI